MQCLVPWTPKALASTGQIEQLQNMRLRLPIIVTDSSVLLTVGKVFLCILPHLHSLPSSKPSFPLFCHISEPDTEDWGSEVESLASSQICYLDGHSLSFMCCWRFTSQFAFTRNSTAGTQSHMKPLSTPVFTPQLITLFLFYRVLFLT